MSFHDCLVLFSHIDRILHFSFFVLEYSDIRVHVSSEHRLEYVHNAYVHKHRCTLIRVHTYTHVHMHTSLDVLMYEHVYMFASHSRHTHIHVQFAHTNIHSHSQLCCYTTYRVVSPISAYTLLLHHIPCGTPYSSIHPIAASRTVWYPLFQHTPYCCITYHVVSPIPANTPLFDLYVS